MILSLDVEAYSHLSYDAVHCLSLLAFVHLGARTISLSPLGHQSRPVKLAGVYHGWVGIRH